MERDMLAGDTGGIMGIIVDITDIMRRAILCGNVSVRVTTRTAANQPGLIVQRRVASADIVTGTKKIVSSS